MIRRRKRKYTVQYSSPDAPFRMESLPTSEDERAPEPANQVEEEKGVGWREELSNWREEAEYWVGFFDTPEGTDEFEQLLDNIELERGEEGKM